MRKRTKLWIGLTTVLLLIIGGVAAALLFFQDHRTSVATVVFNDISAPIIPYSLDHRSRAVMGNTYEGLVALDQFFRADRALALSWTRSSETQWTILLRQGVLFHNGEEMKAKHVVESFDRMREQGDSELVNLFMNVQSFEEDGDYTLKISTAIPDSLLITKLSFLPVILPSERDGYWIGTGPYRITNIETDRMRFERFNQYWGTLPLYDVVMVTQMETKSERMEALINGNIDVLASVPTGVQYLDAIEQDFRFELHSLPSLELFSLFFNVKPEFDGRSNPLAREEVRQAITKAIDRFEIATFVESGFASPIYQFVPDGVAGFLPSIEASAPDPDAALELFGARPISITVSVTEEMRVIGEYLRFQLRPLGVFVELEVLPQEDFYRLITEGNPQAFVTGWRYELGDSSGFLQAYMHTKDTSKGLGSYNTMGISYADVDQLIDELTNEFDEGIRIAKLQQANQKLLDQAVGIPLVETRSVYASDVLLQFTPRLDGQILFSTFK